MKSFFFLSTDLNGTLVHNHTMQEMIRYGFPDEPERYETAGLAFALQMDGKQSLEGTFRIAGEQTRGLPLSVSIDYALNQISYVDGYREFIEYLKGNRITTAVVSTCYSLTLSSIQYTSSYRFSAKCNRLIYQAENGYVIPEEELDILIYRYIQNPGLRNADIFKKTRATGEVILGIRDETDKARVALTMAEKFEIPPSRTLHMGDTMGDSMGILGVARAGGLGIAFNYNQPLEDFLRSEGKREIESGRIVFVDPKGRDSDLENVIPAIDAFRKG